jgi:hypothetical protein
VILPASQPSLPLILSTNVNRAFSKIDEIRATVSSKDLHIFAATESWLTPDMPDQIMSIDGYTIFRDDRSDGRIGGGVAIWTKSVLQPSRFPMQGPEYGTNSVCLMFHNLKFCLLCIYVPPLSVIRSSQDVIYFITNNLDNFMLQNPDYRLFLTGDFNRLNVSYLLNSFDLENCVKYPTRKNAILDLVLLSSSIADQYLIDISSPVGTSDHRSILCTPNNPLLQTFDTRECCVHDLRESNLNAFLFDLSQVNFAPLYDMKLHVNQKCSLLNDIIHSCFLRHIPVHSVLMTPKDKPYITPLIKHLINLRWAAYRQHNFPLYTHLRDKIRKLLSTQKLKWASRAYHGPKEMWKVVNEATGAKSSRSSATDFLMKLFPSPQVAANEINATFAATQVHRPPLNPVDDCSNWTPNVSVESVSKMLSSLNPGKATGIDNIPTVIYKKAATIIAAPLTHIINMSIISREFPDCWKHSIIAPVPKTHPPSKDELRPISLLPIPSKVCERLVLNTGLTSLFRDAFGDLQFGGLKLSSTTSALICVHDLVTSALDNQQCIGVALLAYDFSKAFDCLGHDTIVRALNSKNFPSGFVNWALNYLSNRTQRVKMRNVVSLPLRVTSGVPQGSVFGPYFFNAVVGSLSPVHPSTKVVKYIDDCTYVIPIFAHSTDVLAAEHQNMLSWSKSVGLSLNLKKTKFLWIPRSPTFPPPCVSDLSVVDQVRILGVLFTRDLKWDRHFDNIVKCCSKRLYALRVLRPLLKKDNLKLIYESIVRSLMEYCSPLFSKPSVRNCDLLTKLQKRAHRIICHQDCRCDIFENLNMRRRVASIKFFNSVVNNPNHPLHFLCPPRSSRSARFLQPVARTSRRLNSFFPATVLRVNKTVPD